jgi:hypothetical protein
MQTKTHAHIVQHIRSAAQAKWRETTQSIEDALADNYALLAATVLGEAWRDVAARKTASKRDKASAQTFLHHSPFADSIASVCGVDLIAELKQGGIPWSVPMTQSGYYIELPDSDEGHRHHTDARPIVIKGSLVPLRPGVGEVIVIEHPADMATSVRAVPATNWVQVDAEVAGAISEREYARLLAHVPGIEKRYVVAARRRAMGRASWRRQQRGGKPSHGENQLDRPVEFKLESCRVVEGGGGSGEIGSNLQLLQPPPTC